ncbi:UNVERIFIED_CONTAM: hypothetical protein HDU68_002150 [Siphonaria sp. JEL0065]|nr:hypothetical protein HDU68_002150 [Siphonaria sp. JEL0065]
MDMPGEKEIQSVIYLYWSDTVILVLALAFLVTNIHKKEIKPTHSSYFESVKRAYNTPFNISLILGTASLIGFYLLSSFSTIESFANNYLTPAGLSIGIAICLATAEVSYVFYSWFRTEAIAEAIFPTHTQILKRVVYSTPFIFSLQPIALIVALSIGAIETINIFMIVVTAVSITLTIVLDTVFISLFIQVLMNIRKDMDGEMDLRFAIIAKHGICSCSLFYLAHIILAISVLYKDSLLGISIYAFSFSMYTAIVIVLISMKVNLQKAVETQSLNNTAALERAKKIASGNSLVSIASSRRLSTVRRVIAISSNTVHVNELNARGGSSGGGSTSKELAPSPVLSNAPSDNGLAEDTKS